MRSLLTTILVALAFATLPLDAQLTATIPELRYHYSLSASNGDPVGKATKIVRLGSEQFQEIVLYRSTNGDELVVDKSTSYPDHEMRIRISDVKGEAWIRSVWKLPFTGTTREEVLKEVEIHPELLNLVADDLRIETNGGSWQGTEQVWKAPDTGRELTASLRRSLSFNLLEVIERTSDTFFSVALGRTAREAIVGYVLYRSGCVKAMPLTRDAIPDCRFDETFGFGCSKQQQSRAEEAKEAATPPDYY